MPGAEQDIGIGTRVRAARQRLDWTREALAFHSGISWSAISQVEAGRRRNLRPSTLSALAGALGVSMDYLVSGGASSPPMLEHRVLVYSTDEDFLSTATPFLRQAGERAEAALAVTSAGNIELLRNRLSADAALVKFSEHREWCMTPQSALDGYRAFLTASLSDGAPWVRILSETAGARRPDAEPRLWARYESLMNLVLSASPATVLCAYDARVVDDEILQRVRATHPETVHGAILSRSPEYAEPVGFVLES